MTIRETTKTPPFVLDGKRAIAKSLDHRGREQLGFGSAREVWIDFALAPLASGLTDSIDIRFIGGAYWYRVKLDREQAFKLLEQEPATEELRHMITSRYSLEASPRPRVRLSCQFVSTSRRCDREAESGWTTCKAHHNKGGPRELAFVPADTDQTPLASLLPPSEERQV